MKLNKVFSICKKEKRLALLDVINDQGEKGQWLGDMQSLYRLRNLPNLDESAAMTLMGEGDTDGSEWHIVKTVAPDGLNFNDIDEDEIELRQAGYSINYARERILSLTDGTGIIQIYYKYIEPMFDKNESEKMFLTARSWINGRRCVAVKRGMLLVGIIAEIDVIDSTFVDTMEEFARLCKDELKARGTNEEYGPIEHEFPLFTVDPDGEEWNG